MIRLRMWPALQNALPMEEESKAICVRPILCCQLFNGKEVGQSFRTVDNPWLSLRTQVSSPQDNRFAKRSS